MPYSFASQIAGTPDPADKRAALQQCRERNARLVAEGQPPLPLTTNAEIKTAYEAYFADLNTRTHLSFASQTEQQGALSTIFDEDQLKALRRGLLDRYNSGQTPDQILTDCIS